MEVAFREELDTLLRHVPEVFEDDDHVTEALREKGIQKVRDAIARRWIAIRTLCLGWHPQKVEEIIDMTKSVVHDLLTIHGAEIPFVPDPNILVASQELDCESLNKKMDVSSEKGSSSGKSSHKSFSSCDMIPHEFRFLRTKIGVWSCLLVS